MSLSGDERLAIAIVAGALFAVLVRPDVPLPLLALAIVAAIATLRPRWLVVAFIVVLAQRADSVIDDLEATTTRPVESATVELVADPRPRDNGWSVQVDLHGHRLYATARLRAASELATMASGDSMTISGSVRGRTPESAWARSRRVVGTLSITDIHDRKPAGGLPGLATHVRDHLRRGASSLSGDHQALFTGLVYGDDRLQSAVDADNFRAAGLGHLLAVSGQNVLFVLVLAAPLLSRIRSLDRRVVATIVVLVFFGFMTRFEPSVTRALVMAGIASAAASRGRPAAALHTLPAAVVMLLLWDPLLGFSLAFQLSVAATGGLIIISPRLVDRFGAGLPGSIRNALAATTGAQLAVAPLVLLTFGSMSPIAIPANLLAGPAAAAVMVWGLTAGMLAGFAPDQLAALLHVPTRAAIWWIDRVATISADQPVGEYRFGHLVATVAVLAALGLLRSVPGGHTAVRRLLQAAGATALVVIALAPVIGAPTPPPGTHVLAPGVVLTRSNAGDDVVLIDGSARAADTISALRRAHLGRVDLLVATTGGRQTGRLVRVLRDRFDIVEVWAPPDHQVPGARLRPDGVTRIGALTVTIAPDGTVVVDEELLSSP